jgi:hypothetical protein
MNGQMTLLALPKTGNFDIEAYSFDGRLLWSKTRVQHQFIISENYPLVLKVTNELGEITTLRKL